ncbi:MAG: hypothetical protein ACE5F9_07365 [Phycisphaerae bacterium]
MLVAEAAGSLPHAFNRIDWLVVAAYLVLTTLVGARLAGKQSTIRDFFLAGRRLPWWAICGSIIATEISAVTFIGAPAISFADGGNLTYLQLALGAVVARLIIGFYFVPEYYAREIYSPYDYAEHRLGAGARKATTGLFLVGGILGQGARVYVTALVLSVIADWDLGRSIWAIGMFSVGWTLMGGMTTVIWTDLLQFVVLMAGACAALGFAIHAMPDSLPDAVRTAAAAGKFQLLDLRTNPSLRYTLWCGLLATPFVNLAAFGTDQVMAQRMFCCRNRGDARKAIIASSASVFIAALMLAVGIALYVYFLRDPFTAGEAAMYTQRNAYLLPIFIVRALPTGVRGLIVAAIFASAVSTLDSTLAALSQTTLAVLPRRRHRGGRPDGWFAHLISSDIGLSKALVVLWGGVLCLTATVCIALAEQQANVVDLALALVGYTYGPLLGIFLLAFLPMKRDASGLIWAVPMSVLAVFGMLQHGLAIGTVGGYEVRLADWIVWLGAAAILVAGLIRSGGDVKRTAMLAGGAVAIVFLHRYRTVDELGQSAYAAFTWTYPIGTAMTFVIAYVLGRPTERPARKVGTARRRSAAGKRGRRRAK